MSFKSELFFLSVWCWEVGFSEAAVRGKRIRKPDNGADPRAVSLLLSFQGLHEGSATKMEEYRCCPTLHESTLIHRMCFFERHASMFFLKFVTCCFLSRAWYVLNIHNLAQCDLSIKSPSFMMSCKAPNDIRICVWRNLRNHCPRSEPEDVLNSISK